MLRRLKQEQTRSEFRLYGGDRGDEERRNLAWLGPCYLRGVFSFLSHNFTEVLVSHCPGPREVDMAAHILVSHLEGSQSIVWIEEPLDYLTGGLADDVTEH
jgi:hypothetical protein